MEKTTYHINHSFREKIIVPLIAIRNNIEFLDSRKEDINVITADNTRCEVADFYISNILDLEDSVKAIYHVDLLSFLKKWHSSYQGKMDSFSFVVIELREVEDEK